MHQSIAVIGLGYVGLPLALAFTDKGFCVTGIDLDQKKLQSLRQGASYLPDIPDEAILTAIANKSFIATDDYACISRVDAVVICVPTPLDEEHKPDIRYLEQVGQSLGKQIKKGQLIVLESSTYPGTSREVLKPLIEEQGYQVGEDIYLAYSPERIDPGNQRYKLEDIPKVIGGITKQCTQHVYDLYSKVFHEVITVSSTEVAELSKLLENSYRFINISFMNEFAMICDRMNIDVWEVIEAARTKPYGFSAFYPGPGIGGHCIPVDPLYLQWRSEQYGIISRLIECSQSINLSMPQYVIEQLKAGLRVSTLMNIRIIVVGIAYKRDLSDTRESSAIEILRLMVKEEAKLSYHDPYIPEISIDGYQMSSIELTEQSLMNTDAVVIITDHSQLPLQLIVDRAAFVYDTRNITRCLNGNARVIRLGAGQ
jgi:UDP-N-acetyl-D-glucosamine dehydrogenase